MKYIIVKDTHFNKHAIIFPDELTHKDVARIHQASKLRVVSAGFCRLEWDTGLQPFGFSESLQMGPQEDDKAILDRNFRHFVSSINNP